MACNIELKARLRDPAASAMVAAEIATSGPELLIQRDTYFRCARGRLKIREQEGAGAVLIWYQRENAPGAKQSDYQIISVADSSGLTAALDDALGIEAVVCKRRELWFVDNIRIHLDEVESLGSFLELEAVLGGTHNDAVEATRKVGDLAKRLGVREADRIACSYRELVLGSPVPIE